WSAEQTSAPVSVAANGLHLQPDALAAVCCPRTCLCRSEPLFKQAHGPAGPYLFRLEQRVAGRAINGRQRVVPVDAVEVDGGKALRPAVRLCVLDGAPALPTRVRGHGKCREPEERLHELAPPPALRDRWRQ